MVYSPPRPRRDTDLDDALRQVREAVRYGGVRRVLMLLEVCEGVVTDYRVERITKRDDDWGATMTSPSRRTL